MGLRNKLVEREILSKQKKIESKKSNCLVVKKTNKIISILKSFVVTALPYIAIIVVIAYGAVVAEIALGSFGSYFLNFLSIICALPLGLFFAIVFFVGVGAPANVGIIPGGAPGTFIVYNPSRGSGAGAAVILNIIKLVLLIPFGLMAWLISSIRILFSKNYELKINAKFRAFIDWVSENVKISIVLVVIFAVMPASVFGFKAIDNAAYPIKDIKISANDIVFSGYHEIQNANIFIMDYSIKNENQNKEIDEIYASIEIFSENYEGSVKFDENRIARFTWNIEQHKDSDWTLSLRVDPSNETHNNILSDDFDCLKVIINIKSVSYSGIFGNHIVEYKNGYEMIIKDYNSIDETNGKKEK